MKFGQVAIVGKPNVGKSTLLNTILAKKTAIVSYKPQTTRNQIFGIYSDADSKITFIDTPGYHTARNKLDVFLNSQIKSSFKQADLVVFLIDLSRDLDSEDLKIIDLIKEYRISKIIICFTKNDLVTNDEIDEKFFETKKLINFSKYEVISAGKKVNIDKLLQLIKSELDSENTPSEIIEQTDDFVISEIIREQLLLLYRQELPYSAAVYIENKNFDQVKQLFNIEAVIVVEKESQKPIIIGKGGLKIKELGINSRLELLNFFDCRINLKLFVKVEKEWRNDIHTLKTLGYDNKH